MKPQNLEIVNRSFERQAENFESQKLAFAKAEYMDYTLKTVSPNAKDSILEVAAGTCVCGRAFAPLVHSVVCIDATETMLNIGKQAAKKNRVENITFVKGFAEELPFLADSFDIVFSRLAFHHFEDTNAVFSEMVRVLKPGGKLVLIDMEAAEEVLRETEDKIETLRDPSHVRNLSKEEMRNLFCTNKLSIQNCETIRITQHLNDWLSLTHTPKDVQAEITDRMQADIDGKEKTGFYPYVLGEEICFDQRWVMTIGIK